MVNAQNHAAEMTRDEIKSIFCGDQDAWPDDGQKIERYVRNGNSGTFEEFNVHWLNSCLKYDPHDPNRVWSEKHPEIKYQTSSSNELITKKVEGDRAGIGFVGFAYRGAKVMNVAVNCPRNDIRGSLVSSFDSIRSEEYPSRKLYLYSRRGGPTLATQLIDFVERDGQKIVNKEGFVGLEPRIQFEQSMRGSQDRDVRRVEVIRQSLRRQPLGPVRVITTFRFNLFDFNTPNTLAQRDVERLAEFLVRPENVHRQVFFLGFEDTVPIQPNQRRPGGGGVALGRAKTIRALVEDSIFRRTGRHMDMNALTVGDAYVACDDPERGNELNRRVEVWLAR
jgi:phosphate transport system substrate-binding protein